MTGPVADGSNPVDVEDPEGEYREAVEFWRAWNEASTARAEAKATVERERRLRIERAARDRRRRAADYQRFTGG